MIYNNGGKPPSYTRYINELPYRSYEGPFIMLKTDALFILSLFFFSF